MPSVTHSPKKENKILAELTRSDDEILERFNLLKYKNDVASLLEIPKNFLDYYLYRNRENMYTRFSVKKRDGSLRYIYSPAKPLKILQRKILYVLSLVYKPKFYVHGFVKNKNSLSNAETHLSQYNIFNIDFVIYFFSCGLLCFK